jgi:peptidyl-prolyl cis-trans isomerase SurA
VTDMRRTGRPRAVGRPRGGRWRAARASIAAAAAAAALAAGAPSGAEVVNRIVATIDGEPVTLIELERFSERWRRGQGDPSRPALDQGALLEELVLEKIMQKEIEAQGLTAADPQIDDYIATIRARNNLTEEELKEALAQQGMTWDDYRAQVRGDIERANLINREIRSKVNVSPEEVERYYQAHLSDYETPSRVHVRLISLLVPEGARAEERAAVRERAEAIRAQAAGGKDFATLAKEHSQGPGAADGGDLGEIAHGEMQPEFEQAAFALKPGKVSEVIENDVGFHVLKVEKQEKKSHRPLEEVRDEIGEKLYRETIEERYDRWLKQDLRARHHVEIFL